MGCLEPKCCQARQEVNIPVLPVIGKSVGFPGGGKVALFDATKVFYQVVVGGVFDSVTQD